MSPLGVAHWKSKQTSKIKCPPPWPKAKENSFAPQMIFLWPPARGVGKLPVGKYSVGIYSWHQNWGTLRCSVLCWTNLWKPKPTEWWSRLGSSHHNILSSGSGAEQCPVLCALLHCYIRPGEHQQRVDCVHCGSHFATHWFPREQTCWTVNTWTTGVSAKTNSFQKYM